MLSGECRRRMKHLNLKNSEINVDLSIKFGAKAI